MQIVIDIPDDIYEQTISGTEYDTLSLGIKLRQSVQEGVVIPKGHGRLIDYGYVVDAIDDWVNAEEYRYTNATDYLRMRVANTPIIIEADKVESEDKE